MSSFEEVDDIHELSIYTPKLTTATVVTAAPAPPPPPPPPASQHAPVEEVVDWDNIAPRTFRHKSVARPSAPRRAVPTLPGSEPAASVPAPPPLPSHVAALAPAAAALPPPPPPPPLPPALRRPILPVGGAEVIESESISEAAPAVIVPTLRRIQSQAPPVAVPEPPTLIESIESTPVQASVPPPPPPPPLPSVSTASTSAQPDAHVPPVTQSPSDVESSTLVESTIAQSTVPPPPPPPPLPVQPSVLDAPLPPSMSVLPRRSSLRLDRAGFVMPAIAMPPESVAELEEVAQNEDAEPLSHSETIGEPEVEENDDLELSDVAKAQLALQKKSTIVTAADAETEAEKRRGVLNLWTGREGRVHRGATLSTLIAARESPLSPMPVNTTESQFRAAAFPQRLCTYYQRVGATESNTVEIVERFGDRASSLHERVALEALLCQLQQEHASLARLHNSLQAENQTLTNVVLPIAKQEITIAPAATASSNASAPIGVPAQRSSMTAVATSAPNRVNSPAPPPLISTQSMSEGASPTSITTSPLSSVGMSPSSSMSSVMNRNTPSASFSSSSSTSTGASGIKSPALVPIRSNIAAAVVRLAAGNLHLWQERAHTRVCINDLEADADHRYVVEQEQILREQRAAERAAREAAEADDEGPPSTPTSSVSLASPQSPVAASSVLQARTPVGPRASVFGTGPVGSVSGDEAKKAQAASRRRTVSITAGLLSEFDLQEEISSSEDLLCHTRGAFAPLLRYQATADSMLAFVFYVMKVHLVKKSSPCVLEVDTQAGTLSMRYKHDEQHPEELRSYGDADLVLSSWMIHGVRLLEKSMLAVDYVLADKSTKKMFTCRFATPEERSRFYRLFTRFVANSSVPTGTTAAGSTPKANPNLAIAAAAVANANRARRTGSLAISSTQSFVTGYLTTAPAIFSRGSRPARRKSLSSSEAARVLEQYGIAYPDAAPPATTAPSWRPQPLLIERELLTAHFVRLCRQLPTKSVARDVHSAWCEQRFLQGWRFGWRLDMKLLRHPSLVPYCDLDKLVRARFEGMVRETLEALLSLGFAIEKSEQDKSSAPAISDGFPFMIVAPFSFFSAMQIAELDVEQTGAAPDTALVEATARLKASSSGHRMVVPAFTVMSRSVELQSVQPTSPPELPAESNAEIDEYLHRSTANTCFSNAVAYCDDQDAGRALPVSPIAGEILLIRDMLAQNLHDRWCARTLADNWTLAPEFDGVKKTHPFLRPYSEIPATERQLYNALVSQMLESWSGRGFSLQLACDPRGLLTRLHEPKIKYLKPAKASDKIKSFFSF